ncbi:unnamed protein product [Adineta ricciae]|uniref:Uncharacterized protein n=1 Tax=Adineta ricciae TaxID=249248 RepID=A0A814Y8L9_ADIRI|nr:unnamed protein product [Adineta ricciae]CAF1225876.1 unnamed protein product [Adineta ricciae]
MLTSQSRWFKRYRVKPPGLRLGINGSGGPHGTQEGSASEKRNLSHPSDLRKGSVSLIRNPTWFRKSVSKPLRALRNYDRFCTRHTKPKKFSINAAEPFNGLAITAQNLFGPQNLKTILYLRYETILVVPNLKWSSRFRHSFRRFQQVPAGSLPPDSGRNCIGNIRSIPDRFQLEVCRKRPGNEWSLRLNFRPEPTMP